MNLRTLECALFTLGSTLAAISLGVFAYREIGSRMAIRSFEAVVSGSRGVRVPDRVLQVNVAQPDYGLRSA